MSLIKSIATTVYNFAFTPAEQETQRLEALSDKNRCSVASGFMARDAALLDRDSLEYRKLLQLSEDLVVSHHKASSFPQLCRSHVRRNSGENYYLMAAIGRILETVAPYNEAEVKGGETSALIAAILNEIEEAAKEKNPIKRRSILRNAIKAHVTGLSNDQLNFVIEGILVARG